MTLRRLSASKFFPEGWPGCPSSRNSFHRLNGFRCWWAHHSSVLAMLSVRTFLLEFFEPFVEGPDCKSWCYVISGILAGEIPGFRIVLCCFTHSTVWQCDGCVCVFSFVLFAAIPIPELIQCYHLTFFIVSGLDRRSLSKLLVWFVWFGCLACLFLVLFLLLFVWSCLLVVFSMDCDGCKGRLCTGPLPVHFCGFHPWWRLLVCIN